MNNPPASSSLFAAHRQGRLSRGHIERFATELAMRHCRIAAERYTTPAPDDRASDAAALHRDCVRLAQRIRTESAAERARGLASRVALMSHAWLNAQGGPRRACRRPGIGLAAGRSAILQSVFLHEGQMIIAPSGGPDLAAGSCDAADDAAAVVVELQRMGLEALAGHFLAGWVEQSGAFEALGLLRPRIAREWLLWATRRLAAPAAEREIESALRGAADQLGQRLGRIVIITHGLSGAGKTTLATALAGPLGALLVRADAEASRPVGPGLASPAGGLARSGELVDRLESIAAAVLAAGWPVIVESCFLNRANRQRFRAKAAEVGAAFWILDCVTAPEILRQRLDKRRAFGSLFHGQDAAAHLVDEKLRAQIDRLEPLDGNERARAVAVDTGGPVEHARLAQRLLEASRGAGAPARRRSGAPAHYADAAI